MSFYADNMTLYIENLKDSTQKLLELINEFSKEQATRLTYRNQLHFFFTLTMKYQKGNVKNNTFFNGIFQNKILRNKPDQGKTYILKVSQRNGKILENRVQKDKLDFVQKLVLRMEKSLDLVRGWEE